MRISLVGKDCRGLQNLNAGDIVHLHTLQLVSSSTRDLDVQYNFKRAAMCESNQPTWLRIIHGRGCMESDFVNYETHSGRAAEFMSWYNQKNQQILEAIPYRRRQLQETKKRVSLVPRWYE